MSACPGLTAAFSHAILVNTPSEAKSGLQRRLELRIVVPGFFFTLWSSDLATWSDEASTSLLASLAPSPQEWTKRRGVSDLASAEGLVSSRSLHSSAA